MPRFAVGTRLSMASQSANATDRHCYRFGGMAIESAIPIPELRETRRSKRVACRVMEIGPLCVIEPTAVSRHEWRDHSGTLTLAVSRNNNACYLRLPGIGMACIDATGHVGLHRAPETGDASLHHALLDQILPRVLAGDGELMLHAAAVTDEKAGTLLLLADSGQGKSTLCAALVHAGATLLSDDCLRIVQTGDSVEAIPTYPGLRLLPDSLGALYGDHPPETTPVAGYTSKRRLSHAADAGMATSRSAPVDAAIILQPPGDNLEIRLRRLPPADATIALVRNSFALDPTDMAHMQGILAKATDAANNLPVYALTYPRDYTRLPDVIAHLRNLPRHQVT